jgi:hypothetical protein
MFISLRIIFLWCNGNTSDSGSDDRGSSPCRKTDWASMNFHRLPNFFIRPEQALLYKGLWVVTAK